MPAIRTKRVPQEVIDLCNEIINTNMTEVNWELKSSNKGLAITINYPDKSMVPLEVVNLVVPPTGPINRDITSLNPADSSELHTPAGPIARAGFNTSDPIDENCSEKRD